MDLRLDVNSWFGLSYSSYLVLPRLFLENMPEEWQCDFIALLNELYETLDIDESYSGEYNVTYKLNKKFSNDPYKDYRRGKIALKNKE